MDNGLKTAFWWSLAMAGTIGLTLLVYWPGLAGPFMLDDHANIGLAYVADANWHAVVFSLTHNDSGLLGRSVSILSFILTGLEYGLDPFGYKYHNLLLHLLNGILLFRLLQTLLPLLDPRLGAERTLLIAGITVALWLVHPLLVSTVMYAVQRMTQLAVFFTLLSLLAYLKARLVLQNTRSFYIYGWCVLPVLMLLAVLSKEIGALLPLYLLLIELLAFRGSVNQWRLSPRLGVFVASYALLPLLLGAIILLLRWGDIVDYSNRTFDLQERLLTQLHVIGFYVQLILVPRIRAMSLFHDDYPVNSAMDLASLALLVFFAALLVLAWQLRSRKPVVSFGLLWFFVSHAMESTFLPLELVFEHRNYLAAAGVLLLGVYLVFTNKQLAVLRWLCPLIVLMFALMTRTRAMEWSDSGLFYQIAVDEHPRSGRALTSFANHQIGQNNHDKAIVLLNTLVELTPNELGASAHLQVTHCSANQRDSVALMNMQQLAGRYPLSVYGLNGLQSLIARVVEGKCPKVTIEELTAVIATALDFAEPQSPNHASLLRLRGILGFASGQYVQAYSDFRTAHERNGYISTLAELLRYQLVGRKIADAEDTLALMEAQNQRRFGIEQHQLNLSRDMLAKAKEAEAARLAEPAVAPTPAVELPAPQTELTQ